MRLLIDTGNSNYSMMVEVEVQKIILDYALQFVMSFPNTQICIVQIYNFTTK